MDDRDKTNDQLINELKEMRQQISALEASKTGCTQAEEELRKGKEFLETVIDMAGDGIMVTDQQGYVTMVNDAMERMLGYSREELLGKHSRSFLPPEGDLRARAAGELKKLLEDGKLSEHEAIWQRKDGRCLSTESNRTLLRNKGGKVIGAVNVIRDVTEKKKIGTMLLQSEKLKSLGELAGGVAHDFNNVLAAILGRVQLLSMNLEAPSGKQERRKVMPDLKKGLDIIEKACLDGAETVRRIQEFSRRRSDDPYFTPVDMNELIDHALEFTKARWNDEAASKGITIHIEKDLSPLSTVAGSPSELREVFTNLINNAVDAMPQGGKIRIRTFKQNRYVGIQIEDTGVGMSDDVRDRIFDPFFTTKGLHVTGLGMSVSYGIITRHKGTISVESQVGRGTVCTVKIPVKELKEIKEGKTQELTKKGRKASILIVEDEEDIRMLLSEILASDGHSVRAASSGKEGIEIFKKGSFDLILTDLGMPGMSGWELASTIKKLAPDVIVAVVTGWGIQIDNDELKQHGVDMIVNKPFKVDRVRKLVQEALEVQTKKKKEKT